MPVDYAEYLKASKINKLREVNELLDHTIVEAVEDVEPLFAIVIDGAIDVVLDSKEDADLICAQLNSNGSLVGKVSVNRLWRISTDSAVPHGEPKCCGEPFMVNGELQHEELGN